CIEAGTDGSSANNTLIGLSVFVETQLPIFANVQVALSGPAIMLISLLNDHLVYSVARRHNVPIIGQGGIQTATDAVEFIVTGATAVGVGTALFYDPMMPKKINAGLEAYLERHGFASIADLVGVLDLGRSLDMAASG